MDIDHAAVGARKGRSEEAGGAAGSQGLPLFSLCQQGGQAGLAPLFSDSVKLTQAQIGPIMGREEEVLQN